MRYLAIIILSCFILKASAQTTSVMQAQRPKLAVGIVVDQMRWDYLYRYMDRYAPNGGFRRLLNGGFTCENTMIPYIPTVTACGHSSIYTGSVPAINGITGNEWWDYDSNSSVYCVGDDSVKTIGSDTKAGQMSPHSLLVTTIGDELRLATNFRSKVVGIALKDRGAILTTGNTANAAYWFDESKGEWISSSYYMTELPKWVQDLNAKKLADHYFGLDWQTLYPLETYIQSTPDKVPYENHVFGTGGFPHNLKQFIGKNYKVLPATPYGNSITFDMAKSAVTGEQLGKNTVTDMLAISLSTPDYIGHNFGPNSVEAEDVFLRLDKDLGDFLDFLDQNVGKGEYVLFLTADHGAAQIPQFLKQHKMPSGNAIDADYEDGLNKLLKSKFNAENLVIGVLNYQVFLNRRMIKSMKLDKDLVNKTIVDYCLEQPGVYKALVMEKLNEATLNETIKTAATNSYYSPRCGDIQLLFKPQWIEGFERGGTTHGAWNPYDSHIPLIWYGWNIKHGQTNRNVSITDIAPTVSALLHIQMPSGSVGRVVEEVMK